VPLGVTWTASRHRNVADEFQASGSRSSAKEVDQDRIHIDVTASGGRDASLDTRRERVEAEAARLATRQGSAAATMHRLSTGSRSSARGTGNPRPFAGALRGDGSPGREALSAATKQPFAHATMMYTMVGASYRRDRSMTARRRLVALGCVQQSRRTAKIRIVGAARPSAASSAPREGSCTLANTPASGGASTWKVRSTG